MILMYKFEMRISNTNDFLRKSFLASKRDFIFNMVLFDASETNSNTEILNPPHPLTMKPYFGEL